MTETKQEIQRQLSVLVGVNVSAVSHAADMLTLHFGPLKQYTTRRGTVLEGGDWALHGQCGWQVRSTDGVIASQASLTGSDDELNRDTARINYQLVIVGEATVQGVVANETGGVCIALSRGLRIDIIPDGHADEEDWRFFAPGSSSEHFVIEGGSVAP